MRDLCYNFDTMEQKTFHFEPDPVDWQQLELLAQLSPAQRLLAMMAASEFALAGIRGAFRRRYPELSPGELNMRVLAYVTPIRGIKPDQVSATFRQESR